MRTAARPPATPPLVSWRSVRPPRRLAQSDHRARAHLPSNHTRLLQGAVCARARQTRDGETLTASAAAGLFESRTSRAATRRDGRSAPRERGEMRVAPLRFSRAVSRPPGQIPTGSRRAVSAGCRSQHRCHRERVNVPRRVSSCCRRVATRVSVLSRRAVCVRTQQCAACARVRPRYSEANCIMYERDNGSRFHTHAGRGGDRDGVVVTRAAALRSK